MSSLCDERLTPAEIVRFAELGFGWSKALEEVLIEALPTVWEKLILAVQDLDEGRRAGFSQEKLCSALFVVSASQQAANNAHITSRKLRTAQAAFNRAVMARTAPEGALVAGVGLGLVAWAMKKLLGR